MDWGDSCVGKLLASKHEDLSSSPRTHLKKLGVACISNLSSGETVPGRALSPAF